MLKVLSRRCPYLASTTRAAGTLGCPDSTTATAAATAPPATAPAGAGTPPSAWAGAAGGSAPANTTGAAPAGGVAAGGGLAVASVRLGTAAREGSAAVRRENEQKKILDAHLCCRSVS